MLDKLKKALGFKDKKLDYKDAILGMAKCIETRDMKLLDKLMLESSRQRFGSDKNNAFFIMRTLIDKAFMQSRYIELGDKYIIGDNRVVANAYYWILGNKRLISNKFKFYDIEKKDLGVFVDTQKGIKVNLDGLISAEVWEAKTEFEDVDYKFFISLAVSYYNQKILKLKVYNNGESRLFFRRVVDNARVRIYSNDLYEEKLIGSSSVSVVDLEDKSEFMLISEGSTDFDISCIELANFCVEKGIGVYDINSSIIYEKENNNLDKNSIDAQVERLRITVDKILECKTLEDFANICDVDIMLKYYAEFIKVEDLDKKAFISKILDSYMKILKKYRFIRISKINFEKNFYKIKLLVEINNTDGFIDVSINKKNNKFIFLTEYLTELIDGETKNIECKAYKLDINSIEYSFCEKSKLFMISAKGKNEYLETPNYIRVNIDTDNGFFSDYLEFGKCYDTDLENSIDNIETEEDIKRWQREKGFTFTTTFLHSATEILKVTLTDNTEFMVKNKVKI